MALNDFALRLIAARKHRVQFGSHARKHSSLRGLDKFTWEAWVKVGAGSTASQQRCYYESQTDNDKIRFATAPTRENNRSILRFELCRTDGGTPTAYTYVLPQEWDDRWHHIAFSANIGEREYNIFFDGVNVLKGTLANAGKKDDENGNKKPYRIGGELNKHYKEDPEEEGEGTDTTNWYIPKHIYVGYNASSTSAYWDGKIDNIRIWTSAKTGSSFGKEMFDHVDTYATDSNLLEEWRFNDGYTLKTNGVKDSESEATLESQIDKGSGLELRIGRNLNRIIKNLPRDFDRPFLGNGLTDLTPPTEPSNLRVVGKPTNDSFRIAWDSSEDNVYVQRYEVDVATDINFVQTLSEYSSRNVGRATDLIVAGLNEGQNYYWRVRAIDSANNSSRWSSTSAFRSYEVNAQSRLNFSSNPSFEDDVTSWEAFTPSGRIPQLLRQSYTEEEERPSVAVNGSEGDHYLRVNNLTTASPAGSGVMHIVPWTKNVRMVCSFYVRGSNTLEVHAFPRFLYSNVVGENTNTDRVKLYWQGNKSGSTTMPLTETWQRVWFLIKPTVSAEMTAVEIRFTTSGGTGLQYQFDLDCILIEKGGVVGTYFDGETETGDGNHFWVTTDLTGEGSYIIEPKTTDGFGYRHRSPSLFNPADILLERPVRTKSSRDRTAPSRPRVNSDDSLTVSENGFVAQWARPLSNYEDIKGYDLDVSLSENMNSVTAIFLPGYNKRRLENVLSYPIRDLKPNTKYYYRVRAFDEFGNLSEWSDIRIVKTDAPIDTEPPLEVELLEPSDFDYGKFVANWKPSFDFYGIANYILSVALGTPNNKILEWTLPPTILSYEVDVSEWMDDNRKNVRYYYSVQAVDEAGNASQGLIFDRERNRFDPITYQAVDVPTPAVLQPVDVSLPLTSVAVVDSTDQNATIAVGESIDLSDTKKLLINLPVDALGTITNAQLYLTREAPHTGVDGVNQYGAMQRRLWADLGGAVDLWANLQVNTTESSGEFIPRMLERKYQPVTVTVTALQLPEDPSTLLFSPMTVTASTAPTVDDDPSRTVEAVWNRQGLSLNVTPLLANGSRVYGLQIAVDSPVTVVSAAVPNAQKQPQVGISVNPTEALQLLKTNVRARPLTAVNIFPNPTFDTVDADVPLFNSTFNQGTTGWLVKRRFGAAATLSYRESGADTVGGAALITITNNPVAANADGDDAPILFTHGQRFRVNASKQYSAWASVSSSNRDLSVLIGLRWYASYDSDASPISTEYCASWRPQRVNEWVRIKLNDVTPPANARFAKVVFVPQALNANETGRFLVDNVHVTVSSDAIPVNVYAEEGATFKRQVTEEPAFMRGPDAQNSVLRTTFHQTGDQIRLTALVDDREAWIADAVKTAVVNYVENPSFESQYGIGSQYAGVGAVTVDRYPMFTRNGTMCLQANFINRNDSGYVRIRSAEINSKCDTAFVASFDAKGTGDYEAKLYLKYSDSSSLEDSGATTKTFSVQSDEWLLERIAVGIETDPDRLLQYVQLKITANDNTPTKSTLYIDNVQIEPALSKTSVPRPYCDGSLRTDNCFWLGAQDSSVSFRNAFLGVVRIRPQVIDPALRCWLEFRYADDDTNLITIKSPVQTMPAPVRWEFNALENPNYLIDDSPSLTNWEDTTYSGTTATWSVNDDVVFDRFGENDRLSARANITSNANETTTVTELENEAKLSVKANQRVSAYVMGRSTNDDLVPFLKFYFYSQNDDDDLVLEGVASDVPSTVTANRWESLQATATVPKNAEVCRVVLCVYSRQSGATGSVYFSNAWFGKQPVVVGDHWMPVTSMPHAPIGEWTDDVRLTEVDFVIEASHNMTAVVDFDAAAIKFNNNDTTTFSGATVHADWRGQSFGSASELASAALTNVTTYAGDKDNTATIYSLIKADGWSDYDQSDAVAIRYNRRRRYVDAILPSVVRWNELAYGAFVYDRGWAVTNDSDLSLLLPANQARGSRAAQWTIGANDSSPQLISTEVIAAGPRQRWSASIEARCIKAVRQTSNVLGVRLVMKFFDARGNRLSASASADVNQTLRPKQDWEKLVVSAYAPENTAMVTLAVTSFTDNGAVSIKENDVFEVREPMLYRGWPNRVYRDGSDRNRHIVWEGKEYASPSLFIIEPRAEYNVLTLPFDPDGVESRVKRITTKITVPSVPALYTEFRFGAAEIVRAPRVLSLRIPYIGDDGQKTQALAFIRQSDQYEREEMDVLFDRAQRQLLVTKGGLSPNTEYIVEITVQGPPGRIRGDREYLYRLVTENAATKNSEKTRSTVSFGGFLLNGDQATYYWINRHNSYSLPNRRMQIETLPRMDGAVEMQSYWDRKTITLDGGVWGETLEQLDANLKDLRAAFAQPKQELRIDTLTNDASYYIATCSSFTVNQTGGEALTGLTWSATFECADPFLYRGEKTLYDFSITSSGADLTVDNLFDEDKTYTVTNNGTVYALPLIQVKATKAAGSYAVVVYNDTTADRLMPKELLTQSEYFILNSQIRSCEKQGGKSVDFSGSFPQLAPGDNKLRFSIKPLSSQRHNLLQNPSADDVLVFPGETDANIYGTYYFNGKKRIVDDGVTVEQVRTQTYNGSPFAALVSCDGQKDNQGIIFRTAKGLSEKQSWDSKIKRTFIASAVVRTDDVSRNWFLKDCFIRIWYTDGDFENYDMDTEKPAKSGRIGRRWTTVTTKKFTGSRKKIDYIELILRDPTSETKARKNLDVSFYVDECRLIQTSATDTASEVDFDINVSFRERFI